MSEQRGTCIACGQWSHGSEGQAYLCVVKHLLAARLELNGLRHLNEADAAIGRRVREAREASDAMPRTRGGMADDLMNAGKR